MFASADGTRLAYHTIGTGRPLVCVPGGPMRASAYLGDFGGLSARRALVLLDLRGTGDSEVPVDRASYRCDRQVDDIEALRVELGLDRLDLAGHSGGATLAVLYAARYPDRVDRLVLVCPGTRPVGIEIEDADRREVAELRRGEPWFADAFAAFERIWSGESTPADWEAISPFMYGRWDADTRAAVETRPGQRNEEAAALYYAEGALDPPAVRSAIASLPARVLLLAGEYDAALPPKRAAEYAELFANAELVVQPGAGHSPWLDDPERFARTVSDFLG
jgi:pimeloyl-ACP methyl ester carboxylesterase